MGKESKIRTIKLSKKNSKGLNKIMKNGIVIIAFFMKPKQCTHCEALKPTWNQLMKKYRKISTNMPCALATSVVGTEGLIESDDTNIEGFPTIRVFRSGKKYGNDYEQERSFDALSRFIDNQFGIAMSGGSKKYKKKLRTLRRKKRRRRRTRKKRKKSFFSWY
tara:strand:- start:719 stop:1207 length:489 start_codon:yes stop_codon:yes gene_type:complete